MARIKGELEMRVVMAAMALYETEQTLERGFPGATCSGPERHYMAKRLEYREALEKACEALKREKPAQWDSDYIRKSIKAASTRSARGQRESE